MSEKEPEREEISDQNPETNSPGAIPAPGVEASEVESVKEEREVKEVMGEEQATSDSLIPATGLSHFVMFLMRDYLGLRLPVCLLTPL